MWPLVFLCVSAVAGAPVNQTQLAASNSVIDPKELANSETLEELHDDLFTEEGDIMISVDRNAVQTLWPDATMPYTISPELAHRAAEIQAAFKMISDYTCIRFQPHTTEFNYARFKEGNGCASHVGCQGGAQTIFFSRSCSMGNLCHEIIHALGLHHEHNRDDRDQFITVQWQSIMPGRQKNFKVKSGNTLQLPYDLGSIMHYGKYFFTLDGSATLLAKTPGGQMGQRTHLSQLDVQKLNRLYRCEERRRGR